MFAQLTVLVLAGLAGPLLAGGRRGLVPVVVGELAAGVAHLAAARLLGGAGWRRGWRPRLSWACRRRRRPRA